MQVHAVQLDIAWEDADENVARIERLVRSQTPNQGDLVAVPEMATSGFSMDLPAATRGHEQSLAAMQSLAASLKVHLVLGIAVPRDGSRGANRAVVIGPDGSTIATYTKMHPYSLGGEADAYNAGDQLVTFQWNSFTVAPFICYDLRFPELFRAAVRKGTNLYIVIANWPIARTEHWVTLLRARAIENQAYVLGVNRCGRDPNLLYPGRSMLVDPMGVIRADAGDRAGVMSCPVDPAFVGDVRRNLPFLRDMRSDSASW